MLDGGDYDDASLFSGPHTFTVIPPTTPCLATHSLGLGVAVKGWRAVRATRGEGWGDVRKILSHRSGWGFMPACGERGS